MWSKENCMLQPVLCAIKMKRAHWLADQLADRDEKWFKQTPLLGSRIVPIQRHFISLATEMNPCLISVWKKSSLNRCGVRTRSSLHSVIIHRLLKANERKKDSYNPANPSHAPPVSRSHSLSNYPCLFSHLWLPATAFWLSFVKSRRFECCPHTSGLGLM